MAKTLDSAMSEYHANRKAAGLTEIKMRMPGLPPAQQNELVEICLSMSWSDLGKEEFARVTDIAELYEQKCGGSALWLLRVIPMAIAEINKISHPYHAD